MPTPQLTAEIVNAAILGMEAQKEKLDAKIAELRAWLTDGSTQPAAPAEPVTPKKRRKMSATARKRIGDAQRKRWAPSKKVVEAPVPEAAPKTKRKLSAAGRKAIVAATKKRWAAVKAAKPAERAPAKKKMSPARKAALVANLAKARAARAAKRGAAA